MPLKAPNTGEKVRQAMEVHGTMIYRLAYARTLNRADAEDIFQEVMLRLAFRDAPFDNSEHEKAWLIRVTCNLSIHLIKSAWRRHTVGAQFDRIAVVDAHEQFEENEALTRALSELDAKYRAPIHLFYFEDLSIEEIARILQRNASTIRSQLTRGRDKLKQFLMEGEREE